MTKIEFKAQAQTLGVNANTIVKLADLFTDETTRKSFLTELVEVPETDRQKFAEQRLKPATSPINTSVIVRRAEHITKLGKVSAIRFDQADERIAKDNKFVLKTERSVDAQGFIKTGAADFTRSHYNITLLTSDGKIMNITAGHRLIMRQLGEYIEELKDVADALDAKKEVSIASQYAAVKLIKDYLLGSYITIEFNYFKAFENDIQISYQIVDDSAAESRTKTCLNDEYHVTNVIPDLSGDFAEMFEEQRANYKARDKANVDYDIEQRNALLAQSAAAERARVAADNNASRVALLKSLVPEGMPITAEHIELFKLMEV